MRAPISSYLLRGGTWVALIVAASFASLSLLVFTDGGSGLPSGIKFAPGTVEAPESAGGDDGGAPAGLEGYVIASKVAELEKGHGFNAATGEYGDLVKAGVIDPVKVTRSAVVNAASIARMVLTTESAVVDKPEPPAPAAGGHGHGHGHGHWDDDDSDWDDDSKDWDDDSGDWDHPHGWDNDSDDHSKGRSKGRSHHHDD